MYPGSIGRHSSQLDSDDNQGSPRARWVSQNLAWYDDTIQIEKILYLPSRYSLQTSLSLCVNLRGRIVLDRWSCCCDEKSLFDDNRLIDTESFKLNPCNISMTLESELVLLTCAIWIGAYLGTAWQLGVSRAFESASYTSSWDIS